MGNHSATIDQLLEASISENSSKVYKQGIQAFINFRMHASLDDLWPPPLVHVVNFIAFMKESGLAHSTAKCYMSGLSYVINLHGWENPTECFLVRKLMVGFKRTREVVDIIGNPLHYLCLHK